MSREDSFQPRKVDFSAFEEEISARVKRQLSSMTNVDKINQMYTNVEVMKEHVKGMNGKLIAQEERLGDQEERLRNIEGYVERMKGSVKIIGILCSVIGVLVAIVTKVGNVW